MPIKQQINEDLKQAMLAGDKTLVTTLRGLKSAILNVEVAKNARETGLSENEVITILQKEAKSRQESADLFAQGGNHEKANAELTEKAVIEKYLPDQMNDEEVNKLIDQALQEAGASGPQDMGRVIGMVKQKAGGRADGATIARLVRMKLEA